MADARPQMLDLSPATTPALSGACLFCPDDLGEIKAGPVIARGKIGYLMWTTRDDAATGQKVVSSDHMLFVPHPHIYHESELPRDWTGALDELFAEITGWADRSARPGRIVYWIEGEQAGRSQQHFHVHVRLVYVGGTVVRFPNRLHG